MLWVLRHASLIDGTGAPATADAAIVVEDNVIREVGEESSVKVPAAAQVIECRGKSVLPGLMDMHVHLNIPTSPYDAGSNELRVTDRSVAQSAMHALDNARQLVARGITTVRDVGSHGHGIFELKRLIESGQILGPRIFACGRAIAMTGGHGMRLSVEADGPDAVRRMAREEMKAGADALKFMASGAGAEARESPYDVQLTQEEMAAGIREAKARHRTTCAHAVNPESVRNAVLAGIDSIEHGVILDEASLLLMQKHKVHFVPTVWTYQMTASNGELYGTEPWVVAEVKKRVQVHLAAVARARELGVEIVAGTDSALPINPPDSLFWEMEWLMHCGLSAVATIRAASLNAARLLQIDDHSGTVEAGKVADLLVVDGDPVADIRAIRRTHLVMRDGAFLVREGRLISDYLFRDLRKAPEGPLPSGERAA